MRVPFNGEVVVAPVDFLRRPFFPSRKAEVTTKCCQKSVVLSGFFRPHFFPPTVSDVRTGAVWMSRLLFRFFHENSPVLFLRFPPPGVWKVISEAVSFLVGELPFFSLVLGALLMPNSPVIFWKYRIFPFLFGPDAPRATITLPAISRSGPSFSLPDLLSPFLYFFFPLPPDGCCFPFRPNRDRYFPIAAKRVIRPL